MHDNDGVVLGWAGTAVDLTGRKLSEARYRELVEHANDAVVTTDPLGNFTSVNAAAEAMTGYTRDELLAMSIFGVIAPERAERIRRLMVGDPGYIEGDVIELELIGRDGRRVHADVTARLVTEHGSTVRIEAIARNTTERHELERRLDHQAVHDTLTGLPNRLLLLDRLGQSLARSRRGMHDVVVMVVDLDNFKLVNDSLGHAAGDELLVAAGTRLGQTLPENGTAGRMAGDELPGRPRWLRSPSGSWGHSPSRSRPRPDRCT